MGAAPLLVGDAVIVRRFEASDIGDAYVGWLNDPEVVRLSNQRFRSHDADSCRRYFESFAGTDNLFLAVCLTGGRMVGTMTVYRAIPHETADVGIMIGDRSMWGQGIGQEAWMLVIDWLIGSLGLRKVTAGTLACNHGMVRLMERSGMAREAVRRAQELVDSKPEDIVYHARFRD